MVLWRLFHEFWVWKLALTIPFEFSGNKVKTVDREGDQELGANSRDSGAFVSPPLLRDQRPTLLCNTYFLHYTYNLRNDFILTSIAGLIY